MGDDLIKRINSVAGDAAYTMTPAIRALLHEASQALSRSPAPSGGVYVPVEPTEAMLDAWHNALERGIFGQNGEGQKPHAEYVRDAYAAMLAAAPSTLALEPVGWVSSVVMAQLAESDKGCETANIWKSKPTDGSVCLYAHKQAGEGSALDGRGGG